MTVRRLIINGTLIEGVHVLKKTIGMPPMKTNYVDIPGANGQLDLSTAITGGPRYSNRDLSFDLVLVDAPGSLDLWAAARRFGAMLHGQFISITTDDAADSYYVGRAQIGAFDDADADGVKFTLSVNADPYRIEKADFTVNVLATSSGTTLTLDIGDVPVQPLFTGTGSVSEGEADPDSWRYGFDSQNGPYAADEEGNTLVLSPNPILPELDAEGGAGHGFLPSPTQPGRVRLTFYGDGQVSMTVGRQWL